MPRSSRPRRKNDSAEVRAAHTVETVSAAPATAATASPPWILRGSDGPAAPRGGTRGRLTQPGELLLHLADVVGHGLRVRQPAVAHPAAYDVADGREQRRGGAGGEQRAAVLARGRA